MKTTPKKTSKKSSTTVAELEEKLASMKAQRDALLKLGEEQFNEMTLEEHRDRAIGVVGNLVQKMEKVNRPDAAEWNALFDMLLAAIGAAPSQVTT